MRKSGRRSFREVLLTGFIVAAAALAASMGEPKAPDTVKMAKFVDVEIGNDYLKQAQAAFTRGHYDEAQQKGELAYLLIADLKWAPLARRQAVEKFHCRATRRYAEALFEEAQGNYLNREYTRALALCEQTAEMYAKLPGTEMLQARAFALQSRVYRSMGDWPGGGVSLPARSFAQSTPTLALASLISRLSWANKWRARVCCWAVLL